MSKLFIIACSGDLRVSLCFNFFINYFDLEFIYHHAGDPKRSLEGHTLSACDPCHRKSGNRVRARRAIVLLVSLSVVDRRRRLRIVHTGHGYTELVFFSSNSSSRSIELSFSVHGPIGIGVLPFVN